MELNTSLSQKELFLIGLEEIYREPLFLKLRLALDKESESQKLHEILSALSSKDPKYEGFLTKMMQAFDHLKDKDFWIWVARALHSLDEQEKSAEVLTRTLQKESLEFNLGMLEFLESPPTRYKDFFHALRRALEAYENSYCTEALRVFEPLEAPVFELLSRIRLSLEDEDQPSLFHLSRGFESFEEWNWVGHLRRAMEDSGSGFNMDCLSRSQIQSKLWALDHIHSLYGPNPGQILLLCGWYGLLGVLMSMDSRFEEFFINSYDKDPLCAPVGERLNKPWTFKRRRFRPHHGDIYDLNYHELPADLIINTSCEHLPDFQKWRSLIPSGSHLVLQSNNDVSQEDHLNCSSSLEEFVRSAELSEVRFQGILDCGDFLRFMVIGRA